MSNLQLRKAERKQAKLRLGIFGSSGSGKTMSALKLAHGLAEWDKICIIDTENGSADLYSHLGPYNVIPLNSPFTPEAYIEAIKTAEEAGMEVIIVDSITHEWAGTGGILEMADDLAKAAKNAFSVWAKLTPRHNKFINAILEADAHVICCGRSKQDYVLNEVEKNGRTVNVPEKIGLRAITREGFDYEMTISFDLAINHYATTSKDRTGLFMDRPEFVISEKTGQEILEWNAGAAVDYQAIKRSIVREARRLGIDGMPDYPSLISKATGLEIAKDENLDSILLAMKGYKTLADFQKAVGTEDKPAEAGKADIKVTTSATLQTEKKTVAEMSDKEIKDAVDTGKKEEEFKDRFLDLIPEATSAEQIRQLRQAVEEAAKTKKIGTLKKQSYLAALEEQEKKLVPAK